ncbi:hypothetical protein [Methylobacterium pseudosasicola]|uniref:hypothetical protein n=1 Tax=Methylobacterium pseudosasicola TaxID=582667 RepID=UPI000B85FE64|nr:hypothetical protein [Methylobacterium pseudosasicola]
MASTPEAGVSARAARQEDWEARLRHRPSQAQLQRHLAWCRESGADPASSCEERWGAGPATLMRGAPELRGPKGSKRTRSVEA